MYYRQKIKNGKFLFFCIKTLCFVYFWCIIHSESTGMWVRGRKKTHKEAAHKRVLKIRCTDCGAVLRRFLCESPDIPTFVSGCRRLYNRGSPQRPAGSFFFMIFLTPRPPCSDVAVF